MDVAKKTPDIADSISKNTRQFKNDPHGIASIIHYLARLKRSKIIVEATGNCEMPLAAALHANRLPVMIVNHRQIGDVARATVLAKTDKIDARIFALFGFKIKPEVKPIPNKQVREMGNLLRRCH